MGSAGHVERWSGQRLVWSGFELGTVTAWLAMYSSMLGSPLDWLGRPWAGVVIGRAGLVGSWTVHGRAWFGLGCPWSGVVWPWIGLGCHGLDSDGSGLEGDRHGLSSYGHEMGSPRAEITMGLAGHCLGGPWVEPAMIWAVMGRAAHII
jgi:hypothetical protein